MAGGGRRRPIRRGRCWRRCRCGWRRGRADDANAATSQVRIPLAVAWVGMLLAAGAVGMLLIGAVRLSERRGAFVSAVTHELPRR